MPDEKPMEEMTEEELKVRIARLRREAAGHERHAAALEAEYLDKLYNES